MKLAPTGMFTRVGHGAGSAPICEWDRRNDDFARSVAVAMVDGQVVSTPSAWIRSGDVHPRVLATEGRLYCRVCGEKVTVADYDASGKPQHVGCREAPQDTSRAVYALKPVKPVVLPEITWEIEQGTTTVIARVEGRRIPLRRADGTVIRGKFNADAQAALDRLALQIVTEYARREANTQ